AHLDGWGDGLDGLDGDVAGAFRLEVLRFPGRTRLDLHAALEGHVASGRALGDEERVALEGHEHGALAVGEAEPAALLLADLLDPALESDLLAVLRAFQ